MLKDKRPHGEIQLSYTKPLFPLPQITEAGARQMHRTNALKNSEIIQANQPYTLSLPCLSCRNPTNAVTCAFPSLLPPSKTVLPPEAQCGMVAPSLRIYKQYILLFMALVFLCDHSVILVN
jgi:hypothetical protein